VAFTDIVPCHGTEDDVKCVRVRPVDLRVVGELGAHPRISVSRDVDMEGTSFRVKFSELLHQECPWSPSCVFKEETKHVTSGFEEVILDDVEGDGSWGSPASDVNHVPFGGVPGDEIFQPLHRRRIRRFPGFSLPRQLRLDEADRIGPILTRQGGKDEEGEGKRCESFA